MGHENSIPFWTRERLLGVVAPSGELALIPHGYRGRPDTKQGRTVFAGGVGSTTSRPCSFFLTVAHVALLTHYYSYCSSRIPVGGSLLCLLSFFSLAQSSFH